ncbi:MAG: transcriptional regulator [Candidatus Thermoplasmatota archaeon]|jgi:predicted transcriptional regulator|nr:transcriptional regulator [Candidatus Thermoplasmatota archaeon]
MGDLTPPAQKVYDSLKRLGSTAEDKMKTADDIMKTASMGKGLVTNALQELLNKGYVKRVVRQKSAGYFVVK